MEKQRFLNMDLMRYVLSTAVIVTHFNILTNADILFPIGSGTAVGVFFGLSGFLVYGSYLKYPNFKSYLKSRAKRILPPYLFIVLLCAFGLAAISKCSMGEYFFSVEFWKYLLSNACFLNFVQPSLPGVFEDGVVNAVNGSLWTLKVEWALYLSIPVFFWGVKKYKWNVPIAVIVISVFSFLYSLVMTKISDALGNPLYYKLSYQFVGQLAYFYTGVLVYHFRERLINCKWWNSLALVASLCVFLEINPLGIDFTYVSFLCQMLWVFGALLFCLSRPVSQHTSKLGNVSYEMYLFHFPVIQLLVYFGLDKSLPAYAAFLVALLLIVALSVLFHKANKLILAG